MVAEGVAINSAPALEFDSLDSAKEILDALRAYPHIETAIVFDKKGKSVAYRRSEDVAEEPPPALRPDGDPYFEGERLHHLPQRAPRQGDAGHGLHPSRTSRSCARAPATYTRPPPSWCWARSWSRSLLSSRLQKLISAPILPPGRRREPGEPGEGLLPARGEGDGRRAGRPHRRLQRDARADPGARRRARRWPRRRRSRPTAPRAPSWPT